MSKSDRSSRLKRWPVSATARRSKRQPWRENAVELKPKPTIRFMDSKAVVGKLDRNFRAFGIGRKIGNRLVKNIRFPSIDYQDGLRTSLLSRMIENKKLKIDKKIDSIYRSGFKGMDELFSTALMRNFIKGAFAQVRSVEELDRLEKLIDMASNARIPTEHSGFSLSNKVMQHPTKKGKGFFASDYKNHFRMDKERRNYVEKAMQEAQGTSLQVMAEGVKASIEFTLNYFTAPITADNVFKYSNKSNMNIKDNVLQKQLKSRELMKSYYVQLGGNLRDGEDASQTRSWSLELPRLDSEQYLTQRRPPSPRRWINENG